MVGSGGLGDGLSQPTCLALVLNAYSSVESSRPEK